MGIKETASLFCASRNTVCKYVCLFLSSGEYAPKCYDGYGHHQIKQLLNIPGLIQAQS